MEAHLFCLLNKNALKTKQKTNLSFDVKHMKYQNCNRFPFSFKSFKRKKKLSNICITKKRKQKKTSSFTRRKVAVVHIKPSNISTSMFIYKVKVLFVIKVNVNSTTRHVTGMCHTHTREESKSKRYDSFFYFFFLNFFFIFLCCFTLKNNFIIRKHTFLIYKIMYTLVYINRPLYII